MALNQIQHVYLESACPRCEGSLWKCFESKRAGKPASMMTDSGDAKVVQREPFRSLIVRDVVKTASANHYGCRTWRHFCIYFSFLVLMVASDVILLSRMISSRMSTQGFMLNFNLPCAFGSFCIGLTEQLGWHNFSNTLPPWCRWWSLSTIFFVYTGNLTLGPTWPL